MAHYAADCWDAEVFTSYEWIEIAGHADRSCFDLNRHASFTKTELKAQKALKEPIKIKEIQLKMNNPLIGKTFKKDQKIVKENLEFMSEDDKRHMMEQLAKEGAFDLIVECEDKSFPISKEMVECAEVEKTIMSEKYTPSVIEPSFGIGRIVYCIFEHCFNRREDEMSEEAKKAAADSKQKEEKRWYFKFPPAIAPVKCSILPLQDNAEFRDIVHKLSKNSGLLILLQRKRLLSTVFLQKLTTQASLSAKDTLGLMSAVFLSASQSITIL